MRQLVSREGNATVGADGTARIEVATDGWDWVLLGISISTDPPASVYAQPVVTIYLGSVTPSGFREQTLLGNGDRTDSRRLLGPGSRIIGVWTGAPPGAMAVMSIEAIQVPSGEGIGML